jgi:hypothetical protein
VRPRRCRTLLRGPSTSPLARMVLSRTSAIWAGLGAIVAVVALQEFNSTSCYHLDLSQSVQSLLFFVGPVLAIAVFTLFTRNPLRAVGACSCFAPWLVLAYYTDCVRPYSGGGASMIYVAVLFWGVPSAALGALVTGPLLSRIGVTVADRGVRA